MSDHVSKYVPDFSNGDQITLDNLLTHSSGDFRYRRTPEDYDTFARSPHTINQLVALSLPGCPGVCSRLRAALQQFQLHSAGTQS